MRFITITILLLTIAACSSVPKRTTFGAPITIKEPTPVAEVIAMPERFVNQNILLEGAPSTVCKVKGCWMIFKENGKQMRVIFKDYGFFVPLDSEGRRMRLEGKLQITKISQELARHYLEDAGKFDEAKKLVGEQPEIRFLATGVELLEK